MVARDDRREHEMEIGEERERRGEAEPAVEVASVPAVAEREADDRDEPEERQQRRRQHDRRPLDEVDLGRRPRQAAKPQPASEDRRRCRPRRRASAGRRDRHRGRSSYGATAISAAPSRRAPTSDHAAHGGSGSPPSTGTSPKRRSRARCVQKPAASRRSSVRPSTRKRIAASTATIAGDDRDGRVERRAAPPEARTPTGATRSRRRGRSPTRAARRAGSRRRARSGSSASADGPLPPFRQSARCR